MHTNTTLPILICSYPQWNPKPSFCRVFVWHLSSVCVYALKVEGYISVQQPDWGLFQFFEEISPWETLCKLVPELLQSHFAVSMSLKWAEICRQHEFIFCSENEQKWVWINQSHTSRFLLESVNWKCLLACPSGFICYTRIHSDVFRLTNQELPSQ